MTQKGKYMLNPENPSAFKPGPLGSVCRATAYQDLGLELMPAEQFKADGEASPDALAATPPPRKSGGVAGAAIRQAGPGGRKTGPTASLG